MTDLPQLADEAEQAFIAAARAAKTDDEYNETAKPLLGEYLNVLKLMRLKRSVVREAVITHIKMGG